MATKNIKRNRRVAIPQRASAIPVERLVPAEYGHPCECGCGRLASASARFIPGHDMKLRSARLQVERGEIRLKDLTAGQRQAVRAAMDGASA